LSRKVWRIATDTANWQADDLSGEGAKATGGRWNEAGVAMVYASESRALACLETIVHLNSGGLPFNRYLVEITIPEGVWGHAQRETANGLRVGWDAEPAGQVSIRLGTDWVRSGRSALLVVPSSIVREECNILINPAHVDSAGITAVKQRKWLYDPRLAGPADNFAAAGAGR
jgi:RES domain-containing protein